MNYNQELTWYSSVRKATLIFLTRLQNAGTQGVDKVHLNGNSDFQLHPPLRFYFYFLVFEFRFLNALRIQPPLSSTPNPSTIHSKYFTLTIYNFKTLLLFSLMKVTCQPFHIIITFVCSPYDLIGKLRLFCLETAVSKGSHDSWLQLSEGLLEGRGSWVKPCCSRDTMKNNGEKTWGGRSWQDMRKHSPTIRAASLR